MISTIATMRRYQEEEYENEVELYREGSHRMLPYEALAPLPPNGTVMPRPIHQCQSLGAGLGRRERDHGL